MTKDVLLRVKRIDGGVATEVALTDPFDAIQVLIALRKIEKQMIEHLSEWIGKVAKEGGVDVSGIKVDKDGVEVLGKGDCKDCEKCEIKDKCVIKVFKKLDGMSEDEMKQTLKDFDGILGGK